MSRRGASEGKRYQEAHFTNKPLLKTLYKDRANNSVVQERWGRANPDSNLKQDISMDASNAKSFAFDTGFSRPAYNKEKDQDSFRNTSCKLIGANFNHHDPEVCVCEHCTCGRHLCKFHAVAPDMSKASVYQQSFRRTRQVPNVVYKASDAPKNEGPHLDINSIQRKDFSGKKGDDIDRPKPEDLLKTGGPSPNLTAYSSGFPGYKGDNQRVKHTDNMVRGDFPLMSQTTYGKSFNQRAGRAASLEKTPDNLRTGSSWFGSTTYGGNYRAPNPEDYANKIKIMEKMNEGPHFNHQYETVYKNDFLNSQPKVCPAKIALEGKMKGQMSHRKDKFSENMDFKALNPEYHALSTSKHSYV